METVAGTKHVQVNDTIEHVLYAAYSWPMTDRIFRLDDWASGLI